MSDKFDKTMLAVKSCRKFLNFKALKDRYFRVFLHHILLFILCVQEIQKSKMSDPDTVQWELHCVRLSHAFQMVCVENTIFFLLSFIFAQFSFIWLINSNFIFQICIYWYAVIHYFILYILYIFFCISYICVALVFLPKRKLRFPGHQISWVSD